LDFTPRVLPQKNYEVFWETLGPFLLRIFVCQKRREGVAYCVDSAGAKSVVLLGIETLGAYDNLFESISRLISNAAGAVHDYGATVLRVAMFDTCVPYKGAILAFPLLPARVASIIGGISEDLAKIISLGSWHMTFLCRA
jgi:hypothetical protein